MNPNRRSITVIALALLAASVPGNGDTQTGSGGEPSPVSTGNGVAVEIPRDSAAGLEPGPLEHERARLSIRMQGTKLGGAVGGIGSAGDAVDIGGAAGVGVGVTRGLCSDFTGPLNPAHRERVSAAHIWEVRARFTDVVTDRLVFDLEWVRWDRNDDGQLVRGRGDTRRVDLNEGERHLIDFVEVTQVETGQHCHTNVLIDIGAELQEDPALAGTELIYDLWFVEREGTSVVESRKAGIAARQGQRAGIEFEWIVHDLGHSSAGSPFVVAELDTEILGRARRDGSIDLSVRAGRWFRVGYPTYDPVGGLGAGGRMHVNVRPGEVIELVMPSSGGSSTNYRDPEADHSSRKLPHWDPALLEDASWDGVLVTEDAALVNYGRYFEGRQFSLLVSARVGDQ